MFRFICFIPNKSIRGCGVFVTARLVSSFRLAAQKLYAIKFSRDFPTLNSGYFFKFFLTDRLNMVGEQKKIFIHSCPVSEIFEILI